MKEYSKTIKEPNSFEKWDNQYTKNTFIKNDKLFKIVCWKWNKKGYRATFTGEHVNTLRNMVKRNLTIPHEFICITDDPTGIDPDIRLVKLWDNPCPNYGDDGKPNCYYRLKAFSSEMKDIIGSKFLWLDLDTVILSDITPIVTTDVDFGIWKPDDGRMVCNGSIVLHKVGTREYIWNNFNPKIVDPVYGIRHISDMRGSDQAIIGLNLCKDDKIFTKKEGIYMFRTDIKDKLKTPPKDAKIVFFAGLLNPFDNEVQKKHPWIKDHYY